MYSLYIDTHFLDVIICLFKDGRLLEKIEKKSTFKHSIITMPAIREIIDNNSITIKDIGEIIIVNGPGSFTGVRIGVTIGKTMAYSLNIPIKVIDALKVMYLCDDKANNVYAILEKNGAFIASFDSNEYKYIPMSEYREFKETNHVVEDVCIDYEKLYNYIKDIESENVHNIKPLYIKNIEVMK